jgi:hypothetical protein
MSNYFIASLGSGEFIVNIFTAGRIFNPIKMLLMLKLVNAIIR